MVVDGDVPLDDKAKRMSDLLSSFYSPDHSSMPSGANASSQNGTLDAINTTSFDPDQYMNLLRHVEMAAEIKNLDTDLQMLVYENYNRFISATDTIKRMKSNIVGMEANMEQLLDKIMLVQSRSDGVNTSLFEKREQIEKLHRTCNLLHKVQFIYDLPARLGKCIKSEAYGDAVKFYTGAMPIIKAYGDSSFQDCKRASEAAVAIIIKNLQGKLFSDTESIQARAEAAMLLKQLDFPVDSLKAKLLEKLEQSVGELQLKNSEINNVSAESNDSSKHGNPTELVSMAVHKFVEAVCAYRVIFPDSEKQLIGLAQGLVTKHFETADHYVKNRISSDNLMGLLWSWLRHCTHDKIVMKWFLQFSQSGSIWTDVLLMEKVLPEALLPDYSVEMAQVAVKQYVVSTLSHLQHDISDALTKVHLKQKEVVEEHPLQASLEASKKAVLQGSMDVLLNCRQLLEDDLGLLVKLRDSIVNWVQEGFHDFFGELHNHFLMLLGGNNPSSQHHSSTDGTLGHKVLAGLVLVSVQLCAFVEQTVIPRITEEIAASFSGGDVRSYENGTAFVPGEICRMFHSDSEKFLHQYIHMKTRRISVLLKKRFTTPNWMKHKEPREVHMFVDLFLHELQAIEAEVKQILPQALFHKHRRSGSNGSTTSSRSIPLRENKYPLRQDKLLTRSNTQRARSQLLETHLAKLFKQKVDFFTKVEYTQESVVTTIVKLCLKTLQEFVRLKTFNRSGFQQIQLDVHFVRTPLREIVEDEAAIDLLLDEVIVAASERCLDPIPLEPPILDKLLQAKLAKTKEQSQISA